MNVHETIISNLTGRVHGVNLMVALSGVDLEEGFSALNEMVRNRVVEEIDFRVGGRAVGKLYRYLEPSSLKLVVS